MKKIEVCAIEYTKDVSSENNIFLYDGHTKAQDKVWEFMKNLKNYMML